MSNGLEREAPALRVTQLRHYPGTFSMERFSAELIGALATRAELRVEQFQPRTLRLPHRPGSRRQITRLIRYPYLVSRLDSDVFHILDQGMSHLAAGTPAERTVITCHDMMPLRAARGDLPFRYTPRTVARYRFSARYLRGAAAVVCISENSRRDLIELVGVEEERAIVVPLGIAGDFRPLSDPERASIRAGLPNHDLLLLHLSDSRHRYKNVPGVIRTLAALRRGGIDAGLVRAGRHLYRQERSLAGSLGVESAIHEQGFVPDPRLVELYNAVDALLFPSFYEGFGWPVIESMACGTPVVGSDCAAISEHSAGAALLAPATDPDALARQLARLVTSAELAAEMRRRGLERAAGFDWSATAAGYASVYRRVAAGEPVSDRVEPALRLPIDEDIAAVLETERV